MLQECMEVFRENEKKYSMQWFWDNHIPKDGVYILINTQMVVLLERRFV